MSHRIQIRVRPLLIVALAAVTALPLVASWELRRVDRAVDEILDQGVGGFGEVEDLMQALLHLHSEVLLASAARGDATAERLWRIRTNLAELRRSADELDRLGLETLVGKEPDAAVQAALHAMADAAEHFLAAAADPGVDHEDRVAAASGITALVHDAAGAIGQLSTAIASRAGILDARIPRHLRLARRAIAVLAAVAVLALLVALIERARQPASPSSLRRLLLDSLRDGELRDADGRPLRAAPDGPGVTIGTLLHATPMHQTFFGTLHLHDGDVAFWAKRYTGFGALRSRVLPWPAMYARGTWRILRELGGTEPAVAAPLARRVLRWSGLPAGDLVLARSLGELLPLRSDFAARASEAHDPAARAAWLAALRDTLDRLAAAGCFQIKPRYLHVRAAAGGVTAPAGFMLCDLDKVLYVPHLPAWLARRLARRDRRRLLRSIAPRLDAREERRFLQWAEGDGDVTLATEPGAS